MSMFKVIAVTNRHLCRIPFLEQLKRLSAAGINAVILREKDLTPEAYTDLAKQAADICRQHGVSFIAHTFAAAALKINVRHIHMPLHVLQTSKSIVKDFATTGVSVHSAAEAKQAARLGAGCLIAGHIFATASKNGLAPRGISLLKEIQAAVNLPLYAIGGITPQNVINVKQTGIQGVCLMSSLMKADNPSQLLTQLHKAYAEHRGANSF